SAAKAGFRDQIPETDEQDRSDEPDDKLLERKRHRVVILREQHKLALDHRWNGFVARALRHLHEIREKNRHSDRGYQWRQSERTAQGSISEPLDGPIDERGEQHRHDQNEKKGERDRRYAEKADEQKESDQGNEGRHHEHVAVGEVHHANNAEHHGVADGDQAVDRAKRNAVNKLLEEDFHPLPSDVSRPMVNRPDVRGLTGHSGSGNAEPTSCYFSKKGWREARG